MLYRLLEIVRSTGKLDLAEVEQIIIEQNALRRARITRPSTPLKGSFVKSKTDGQRKYIDAIRNNDLVFCIDLPARGRPIWR